MLREILPLSPQDNNSVDVLFLVNENNEILHPQRADRFTGISNRDLTMNFWRNGIIGILNRQWVICCDEVLKKMISENCHGILDKKVRYRMLYPFASQDRKCLLLEEREPIAVPSEGKNRSFYTINRYRTCGTHYDEIPIILLPELINEHGWLLELETQELINRSVINFHEKGYCPFSFAEIRFLCEILKGFPPIKDIAAKLKIELSCAYAHRRNIVSKGRNFSCFFSTPEVIALFCRQMHWI